MAEIAASIAMNSFAGCVNGIASVGLNAIEFIHRRLVALRDAGVAILIVSVELEELLALSDRVLVMCGGRITGERRPDATDERDLGLLMAGIEEAA